MKRYTAYQNDVIVRGQRAIEFDSDPTRSFSPTNDLHQIARVVIQSLDPLCDEWREDRLFLFGGDRPVDAGGENYSDIERGSAVRDKPPNQEVDDLPASDLPRGIRYDEENRLIRMDDLLQRSRTDRTFEPLAYLGVGQRQPFIGCSENIETA